MPGKCLISASFAGSRYAKPDGLVSLSHALYDAALDRLFIGGFTAARPKDSADHGGGMSSVLMGFAEVRTTKALSSRCGNATSRTRPVARVWAMRPTTSSAAAMPAMPRAVTCSLVDSANVACARSRCGRLIVRVRPTPFAAIP